MAYQRKGSDMKRTTTREVLPWLLVFTLLLTACARKTSSNLSKSSSEQSTITTTTAASQNEPAAHSSAHYANARFGFSFDYSDNLLKMGSEPTNGDGRVFCSLKDGLEIFRAYGSNNVLEYTIGTLYAQALKSASDDGFKITYQVKSGNTYTISGVSGDSILYERTIHASDSSAVTTVHFRYPISEKQTWNPEVDKVIGSLQTGLSTTSSSASRDLTFADLSDLEFNFASGVGGWWTTVKITADGRFSGHYQDSDMGDDGPGYPHGTRYVCDFKGRFAELKKVSDYEYSMQCVSLVSDGVEGKEQIIDEVKVINSTPYGFDKAGKFLLYLPGRKVQGLPQGFLDWVSSPRDTDVSKQKTLDFYGLYNVSGKEGFFADKK